MIELDRVVRRARARVAMGRLITALVVTTTAALAAAALVRVAEQVSGVGVAWLWFGLAGAAACLVLSVGHALLRRVSAARAAIMVDHGAGLADSISTGLAVGGGTDAWSANVREQARRAAASVRVGSAVPIAAPRYWPAPGAAAVLLLLVWVLVPQADLFGQRAQAAQREQTKEHIEQAKAEAQQAVSKVQERLEQLVKDQETPQADTAKPNDPEPRTAEEIRRSAIRQLTDARDRLEQLRQGPQGQQLDLIQQQLRTLRSPGPGEVGALTSALAKGDFSKAKEALSKLAEQAANGQTPEQAERSAEQLQSLAEQVQRLAQQQDALKERLAQQGVDPNLAGDPDALKRALADNPALSQEQKRALLNAAQSQESAQQSMTALAAAIQQLAQQQGQQGQSGQSAQQGQSGQSGQQGKSGQSGQQGQSAAQSLSNISDALSALEALQAEAGSIEAALSEANRQLSGLSKSLGHSSAPGLGQCEGGLVQGQGGFGSQGLWSAGDPQNRPGNGQGGPGQGRGGSVGEREAQENWEKRKVTGQQGDGPIISRMFVPGEQEKGQSRQELRAVAQAAEKVASEALENNVVERQYHALVRGYFGTLTKQAESGGDAAAPAPAAPAAPAAGDAKKGTP
ncbi:MAG: hypothetical protein C0475_04810 [Planctomyces sp.]|nr:hypothetical protein [Planctomyces sp.]